MFIFDKKYRKQAKAETKAESNSNNNNKRMEKLEIVTLEKVCALTRQLVKAGSAILPTDKRNRRNGFTFTDNFIS